MRSLVWSSIFALLLMELVVTLILVIPVPRRLRNWICKECSKLDLKKQMQPLLTGIGVGLVLAMLDGINHLRLLLDFEEADGRERRYAYREDELIVRHLDKEKEYKTERNLYLAGFALTLLFVIGRLTDLMQEHADLEDDLDKLRPRSSAVDLPIEQETADGPPSASEIEMKPLQSKKKD